MLQLCLNVRKFAVMSCVYVLVFLSRHAVKRRMLQVYITSIRDPAWTSGVMVDPWFRSEQRKGGVSCTVLYYMKRSSINSKRISAMFHRRG